MKKSIYLFLLLLGIFLALDYACLKRYKRNVLRGKDFENYSMENKMEQLGNSLMIHYKLESATIDYGLILYDTLGLMRNLDSLLIGQKKLCFKFSQYSCEDCILASIKFLANFNYQFLKSNVLIITDYFNPQGLNFKRKELNLPSACYYQKKSMFNDSVLDNSILFFTLDSTKLSNAFVINPATTKYFNLYLISLKEHFNL